MPIPPTTKETEAIEAKESALAKKNKELEEKEEALGGDTFWVARGMVCV